MTRLVIAKRTRVFTVFLPLCRPLRRVGSRGPLPARTTPVIGRPELGPWSGGYWSSRKPQLASRLADAAVGCWSDLATQRDRVDDDLGDLRPAFRVDDDLCLPEDGVAVTAAKQVARHRDRVRRLVGEGLSAHGDVDDAAPRREPGIPRHTRTGELKKAAAHAIGLGEPVLEGRPEVRAPHL